MTERHIVIDVRLEAQPGKAEELARLMSETQRLSQVEDGCIVYRFTADLDQSGIFHAFEIWADEQAIRAHAAGAAFREFARQLPTLGCVVGSTWRAGVLEPFTLKPSSGNGA